MSFIESDFKNIFDTVKEINIFLNMADLEDLKNELIKDVISNAYYVEKLVQEFKTRGISLIFKDKLNDYLKSQGKIVPVTLRELEILCDEVLKKIFTLRPPPGVVSKAVEEYLRVLPQARLDGLATRQAELRELFLQLSSISNNIVPLSEVKSSMLLQSWLRLIDSGDEGRNELENLVKELLSDGKNAETLIEMLNFESTPEIRPVQKLVINVISTGAKDPTFRSSMILIFQSDRLQDILHHFIELFDAAAVFLESLEDLFIFESDSRVVRSMGDIDFKIYLTIVKNLYNSSITHFKMKKFMRIRKHRGSLPLWVYIEGQLSSM